MARRRQEDDKDNFGSDLDLGQSRYESDAEAPKDKENGVRHVQHPGQLREQRRSPEQEDEGLDLAHLRRSIGAGTPSEAHGDPAHPFEETHEFHCIPARY